MTPSCVSVAYLTTVYPGVSHTFIQREVDAVRALGVDVHTFSVHRPASTDVLSSADRESVRTTPYLLPARATEVMRAHGMALLRRPRAYVSVLAKAQRYAVPGLRGRVWQCFYFVEAVLLWEHCRRRGLRHVHAHFANNAADIARLVADLGTATDQRPWSWSLTMHGPTEFSDVRGFGLAAKVRSAAFVACISDFARSQVMSLVHEAHWAKLGVVHCGVDPERFTVGGGPARGPDASLHVLCVGRLVPEKGQAVLLRAVAQLVAEGVPITLRLIGEGPSRQGLEREVRERGVADVVTLVGAVGQDEIGEAYAWADVFCLSSFAEGVPVVLMEAMSCGLPVVTSRIAGIPELVEDGVSGAVVAPGRVEQVAQALRRLAADPALREQWGAAGRQRVQHDYCSRTAAEPLVELFATKAPGAHTR